MSNISLNNLFYNIANSIREKSNISTPIQAQQFPNYILNIPQSNGIAWNQKIYLNNIALDKFDYSLAPYNQDAGVSKPNCFGDLYIKYDNYRTNYSLNAAYNEIFFDAVSGRSTIHINPNLRYNNLYLTNGYYLFYYTSFMNNSFPFSLDYVTNMDYMFYTSNFNNIIIPPNVVSMVYSYGALRSNLVVNNFVSPNSLVNLYRAFYYQYCSNNCYISIGPNVQNAQFAFSATFNTYNFTMNIYSNGLDFFRVLPQQIGSGNIHIYDNYLTNVNGVIYYERYRYANNILYFHLYNRISQTASIFYNNGYATNFIQDGGYYNMKWDYNINNDQFYNNQYHIGLYFH